MIFDLTGLRLGADAVIPWHEIVALHVEEFDVMTGSVTILQVEHASGHCVEIHELVQGYSDALLRLGDFMPLPENWPSLVLGLESGTSVTLWNRDSKIQE